MQVSSSELKKKLQIVGRFSAKKSTMPVLTLIKMEFTGQELTLSAMDYELSAIARLPANGIDEFSVCVPHEFVEFVSTLPDGTIEIITSENKIKVTHGKRKAEFMTADGDQFPAIKTDTKCIVELTSGALSRVSFAASIDEKGQPILNCVNFNFIEDRLVLSAADGYQMATIVMHHESDLFGEYNVPVRAIAEVSKFGTCLMGVNHELQSVSFLCGDVLIVSQLVAGNFPNVNRLIPSGGASATVTISSAVFKDEVARALIFARNNSNITKLEIDGGVSISAMSPEAGAGHSVIDDAEFTGENFKIAFNGIYMKGAMGVISGKARLSFTDPNRPILVECIGDEGWKYVLMPMFVRD